MQITLWFIRETDMARLYCKHGRPVQEENDLIWIPRSIVEHTSRMMGGQHIVTLPEWFIQKSGL